MFLRSHFSMPLREKIWRSLWDDSNLPNFYPFLLYIYRKSDSTKNEKWAATSLSFPTPLLSGLGIRKGGWSDKCENKPWYTDFSFFEPLLWRKGENFASSQYQCRQQVPLCRAPSVTGQTTPCIQRSPQIQRVCCHRKDRKPLSRWSLGKTGWESMGSIPTVLRRLEVPKTMERRREVHIYWTPVMNLVLFFHSWINYEKKSKITETKENNIHLSVIYI